ncbi:hypothetical protein NBRGN_110_02500 [Nocardia brasiliensis NBRC 14402]|uniref:cytochrome C oxidase subunit IV family protein n=1 Tax=Nocardia brasiliensis TaxID=37326 RepID=UPI0002F1E816|nr:cytochrome C oxidase subunit IV family protein [Nocardia brasiliensis]ASF09475.1 hypothetical protein CEQ30_21260 [Nocardia brasiliensis]GAJ86585.1 hypothetical protein NBRGN_110_02500 [Nocardia brasiliensis NBRC 14402]SUB39814.1 Uncharacterised protein [Nocardia brasiliensis]
MFVLLRQRRLVLTWLLLVAATGISLLLGSGHTTASTLGALAVITITFTKIWLVGFTFMELDTAPRVLQILFTSWVVATAVTLAGFYALS